MSLAIRLSMFPRRIPKTQTAAILPQSDGGVVIVHDHPVKTEAHRLSDTGEEKKRRQCLQLGADY